MKFKSDIKEYWAMVGDKLVQNIALIGEEMELHGWVYKIPVQLDNKITKYGYKVTIHIENDKNIAEKLFNNGETVVIDDNKYYRSKIEQNPSTFVDLIEYDWFFEYISYDLFN